MAVLLEVVLPCIDVDERHSLEEALDSALEQLGLGEVTGGGAGASSSNIDVETSDDVAATEVIRHVLRGRDVEPLEILRRADDAERD